MAWVKMHTDILNDPKLMRAARKGARGLEWTPWLIVFAKQANDDGRLTVGGAPAEPEDMAACFPGAKPAGIVVALASLEGLDVLVRDDDGALRFAAWDRRAGRPSDRPESVRERVARHRQEKQRVAPTRGKHGNGTGNAGVTRYIDSGNADVTQGNAFCNATEVEVEVEGDVEGEVLLAADAAIPVPVPAAAAPAALHAEGWSVVRVLAPTITAPPALPLSAADRPGSPADDRPTAPEPAPALFPSGAVPPDRKGAPKAKPRAKVAAVVDAVDGEGGEPGAPAGGKYPHYPQATCAALHTLWLERRGAIDYGRFRKETAPLFTSATPPYTLAELTGALKLCLTVLEERATNPRDRFEWGALTPARWVERVAQWVKDFRQTQEDVEHLFRLVDGAPRGVGMVA